MYTAGKIGVAIPQAMFAGKGLADAAVKMGGPQALATALESFGMKTGLAPNGIAQWLGNQALRAGAGAASSTAASALTDPEHMKMAAGIGALTPAVLGSAGWLGKKTWDTGRNLFSGIEGQAKNYLSEVFGSHPERLKIAQELMALKSGVTGEQPTAGLAAVTGKSPIPQLKALEEGARARPTMAAKFAEIDAANEAARSRPLEAIAAVGRRPEVGQNMPLQLSRAEATRKNITQSLYDKAGKDVVVMDDVLDTILGGAEVQGAANRASISKRQAVANAIAGGRAAPEGIKYGKVTDAYSLPEWGPAPMAEKVVEPSTITIDALKRFKDQLDAEISGLVGSSDAAGKTQLAQLKVARAQIDNWMRSKSPMYKEAQETFKLLSEPQNQADVAQVLLNALKSPSGIERQQAFANAYENAARTIKRADVPRFEQLGQVMSPTQKRMIDAVKESVNREAQYKALDARQSVLPEVQNAMDTLEKTIPGWLNKVVTATRKGLSRAGGILDKESQAMVDSMMADPKKLAAFISQKTPTERDKIAQYFATKITPNVGATYMGTTLATQGE